MVTVTPGSAAALVSQWQEYPGGPAADLTGVTITITALAGGAPVVGPTSTGVTHPAAGVYVYTWAVPAGQAAGDYLAVWSGVDAQGDAVTASEIVSVAGADGGSYAPVRLSTAVRDPSSGAPADPAAVSLVVLLPDGTVAGPYAPVRDGVGAYHYDFTPSLAGRHVARWTTAGPGGLDEEPFDVAAVWSEAGIVSLAAAKHHANIPADVTTDDEELAGFVRAVTEPIERIVGSLVRRAVTERHGGGYAIALNRPPALALTQVTAIRPGSTAPALADLDLDGATGIVTRLDGGYLAGPLRVTYLAGRPDVPAHVRLAALIIIQHMWETQRGQMGGVRRGGSDEVYDPRFGFSIPRRAQELLGDQPPGIA